MNVPKDQQCGPIQLTRRLLLLGAVDVEEKGETPDQLIMMMMLIVMMVPPIPAVERLLYVHDTGVSVVRTHRCASSAACHERVG